MGTVEGSGVETSEESLLLLEPEHGADEEKKGMEEESLIEPTPSDQYIDSFGIADQLYNQKKGNRFIVDSVNTETESNNEASMAHIVDPIEPFSAGLDQSGVTLLREEEVSDFTLIVNNSEVIKCNQIAYDCALTLESDDTFSTDPKISPSQLIQTPCMEITNPFLKPLLPHSIQGNVEDANTDPNTTGGLDTSEVMLLSEEEMSDHVPLLNEVSVSSQMTYDDRTLTTEPCQTDEVLSTDPNISASQLNQTPYSDESHNSFPNSLLLQSVQDQGDNAAKINSNQSPSPSRRRKMGSTRRHPRSVQREEEDTEEKQEVEIESTEIKDKRENMDAMERSCMEFEMLMESKDGAGNEKNEGEERNEETVLTDLSCSFSTSDQEGKNIEADNIESESQSIINHAMTAKLMLPRQSDFSEIRETLHNPDVPNFESHLTEDTPISTEKVREAEQIEVEVNTVMESESSQTDTSALTVEVQESGDMVCIDPYISALQHTQTADMEQCLLTQSNSPSLRSKSSLSLSSQSHEDVGESKATGKRRKMGFTHRTQGGLHVEDEKQETGEYIREAKVRAETIGNPEVNAVLERFQEERRAEAVSLEDQQEIQSTEKETILIEVVASSTVLSGKGSEPVAPAPQPGPGNKRGQEKAERVEKPPGTFGSSGSSSNPYNVVMVGNSSVGKTSFMRRFQSGEFCLHHDATIGIDTCIQSVTVDGSPVTLQLWDTAGQERFHSITRQVFHKAQGLMLMYDITSSQSFCDICYWVNCIQEGAPDDVIVILLGNKTDCAELDREVQTHEGVNLAEGYDMHFMECSAATGDNVTLSMETLARMLKQLGEQTRQEEGSLVLQKEPPMKKSGCC
uniref:EF-hand calcium-binding domain-containing protein 4B-like n=1 Tax=Oncorhynchus gorbuscha TaxID=8017 RepID=UPI001EAF6AEA|nr:EF-hand calcium-binding domain-containing protein 4B-like [Oncorhynchus gorbuscha]